VFIVDPLYQDYTNFKATAWTFMIIFQAYWQGEVLCLSCMTFENHSVAEFLFI